MSSGETPLPVPMLIQHRWDLFITLFLRETILKEVLKWVLLSVQTKTHGCFGGGGICKLFDTPPPKIGIPINHQLKLGWDTSLQLTGGTTVDVFFEAELFTAKSHETKTSHRDVLTCNLGFSLNGGTPKTPQNVHF